VSAVAAAAPVAVVIAAPAAAATAFEHWFLAPNPETLAFEAHYANIVCCFGHISETQSFHSLRNLGVRHILIGLVNICYHF
jgi:hypothetical protein